MDKKEKEEEVKGIRKKMSNLPKGETLIGAFDGDTALSNFGTSMDFFHVFSFV